jgi:glycosyltransferase involved in cell wall biosynthesis
MDNTRIALFMTALGGGGAERVMLNLSAGLAGLGVGVDLVVTSSRGAFCVDVPESVRFVDLESTRIIASLFPLVHYLQKERPRVMLAAMAPTNCIAVWARALAHVPLRLVLAEHTTLTQALSASVNLKRRILSILMRLTYPHADAVVAVSSGVADSLAFAIGLPRERIDVIYNPVVTPKMLEKSTQTLNHPWFRTGEPPVILGVGRLIRAKDFFTLIRAFAILLKRREASLIILGEGEGRLDLEKLVSGLGIGDYVSMPGFVSNPYAYMRRAAVFVLSSRWEGLPTVLIEAIACGAPVISTDCPSGPREILGEKYEHLLTKVGDHIMLANKLVDVLEHKLNVPSGSDPRFMIDTAVMSYMRVFGF